MSQESNQISSNNNNFRSEKEFNFDYELLDRLLGLQRGEDGIAMVSSDGILAPVPGTEQRNDRMGSDWIRQLEHDLEQFIDEDNLSQAPSNSPSPPSSLIGEDFFDQEWNDISQIFSMAPSPVNQNSLDDFFTAKQYQSESDSTSFNAPNPVEALNLNRELQMHVKALLDRTKTMEQQQRDLERVTDLLTTQFDIKFRRKYHALSFWPHEVPTLANLNKAVQEMHATTTTSVQLDSRLKLMHDEIKKYNRALKIIPRWTFKERSALANGIRAQNEKILLGIIQAKGTHTLEECSSIIASFSEIDLLMNVNGIDWDSISSFFVITRSAIDCRLQWTINDHPMINRSLLFEDNQDEIETLKKTVPKIFKKVTAKGLPTEFCSPWQLIASELGTNRTAIQCFMMYQRRINPTFLKGKWTEEEDEQLMTAMKIYGTQNWQAVAQMIDGRTGQQCLHRYEKAINPQIKRGRWTCEEDEILKKAVEPFIGNPRINWSAVKLSVPGRTDVQCRERWVNILDPTISVAPFTPEEDQILKDLIEKFGTSNWSRISIEMGKKRTDNQCWRRWKQLVAGKQKNNNKTVKNGKNLKNAKKNNIPKRKVIKPAPSTTTIKKNPARISKK